MRCSGEIERERPGRSRCRTIAAATSCRQRARVSPGIATTRLPEMPMPRAGWRCGCMEEIGIGSDQPVRRSPQRPSAASDSEQHRPASLAGAPSGRQEQMRTSRDSSRRRWESRVQHAAHCPPLDRGPQRTPVGRQRRTGASSSSARASVKAATTDHNPPRCPGRVAGCTPLLSMARCRIVSRLVSPGGGPRQRGFRCDYDTPSVRTPPLPFCPEALPNAIGP
jgi:hypothetical protein